MSTADGTSIAAPGSRQLRREVARVRRRARAVWLAGAAVAALAADAWYEVVSFWAFRLLQFRIWFPLFSLVAFAVFAAAVVRRTGTLRLAALLDARFALKERLVSASRFERLPRVPADLREAQARETLRAVDFGRLRASFRFRPWGALAFLAAGAGLFGWHIHRFPESFNPSSVVFRQGRVVFMAVKSIGRSSAGEDTGPPGGAPQQLPDSHPQVALVPEDGVPKQETPAAQTGGTPDGQPPPGGEQGSAEAPGDQKRPPGHPETPPEGRGEGKVTKLGADEGGAFGRQASLEETDGISPPTARPESGLAAGAADLRGPNAGPSLPPLPFVRLLGTGAQSGVLFDPETLNIVLEAYPAKYREHLESYLKALQSLKEDRHGS